MKRLLTLLLVLSVGTGCKTPHAVRETILLADSLSYEMPDSALRLIERINPRSLHGKRDRADYGLIYSQVLDKNCVDVDRDTLIRPAVQYYTDRGTPLQRALAYYYWGRTLENADSTARAIEAFTLARRALGDDTLCRTFALICNRLGDAHESQYEFESAARMFRSSVNTFASLGEKYNEMIGCQRMTSNAIMRTSYTEAEKWNERSLKLAEGFHDTAFIINSAIYEANIISYSKKDYQRAIKKVLSISSKYNSKKCAQLNSILCNLYLNSNNLDSARFYLNGLQKEKFDLSKTIGIKEIAAHIEHQSGNFLLASLIRGELLHLKDSLFAYQRKMSTENIIRKYDYTIIQQQSVAERSEHRYKLIVGSLVFLIIILICIWLLLGRMKILRQQRLYIEEQKTAINHIRESEHSLMDKLNIQEQKQCRLKIILLNRFEQIRNIARTKHLYENSKTLKERIDELVFDENIFVDIEETVNINQDCIMDELRQGLYGRFSEPDYRLLSMILFGFTIQECQIFMSYTSENLYARRSRIRQKIRMSNGLKKDYLLGIFNQ